MTHARTNRRPVIFAIAMIWLLVCGGLGWATRLAIELEQTEAREDDRRLENARLERAIARIESEVSAVLYPERARPYAHFRSYYVTTEARYRDQRGDASRDIVVASPLREYRGPDWILLHFQVSEAEGWSSPQLEPDAKFALPAGAIPAMHRAREATRENWLAALKERYTAESLQQVLEETLLLLGNEDSAQARASRVVQEADTDTLGESARRAERLLRLQLETHSAALCEPELVAMENLEAGRPTASLRADPGACVEVYAPLMTPVWLDLTMDGRPQLALVRSATVETSRHCTLQGVLIDWDRLRPVLEAQVSDLFPQAELVPIRAAEWRALGTQRGVLHAIPARLVPSPSGEQPATAMSPALFGGLAVAWGATLLALIAISYGAIKYLNHSERRMQFVAAVTHELRTPLTSFQLYSDLLAEMPAEDGEKRRQYADMLRTEAARLSRLVENVLSYSRVQDTGPALRPRPVTPNELLHAAEAATRPQCRRFNKQLVLENHCPDDVKIETDAEFVVQILTNLVENACKYSAEAEDRRVWLAAAPGPAGGVTIEVDDAGPGVSARDRRVIFDPFRRGDTSREGRFGGLGLGLSLSKYWAECLGGVLMLKRSPRNGSHYSCFALTLPGGGCPVRS